MPSKFRLRKPFKPIVMALAKIFVKLGITPNTATLLMLLCSLLSTLTLIIFENIMIFGILVFITGLMDGVDGAIARLTNNSSNFGGFFDSTMDRISEIIIYMGLLFKAEIFLNIHTKIGQTLIYVIAVSSFMISYTRARAEIFNKEMENKMDLDVGIFARSERLFYLFIISLTAYFVGNIFFFWAIVLFAIGTAGTFYFRVQTVKKYLE